MESALRPASEPSTQASLSTSASVRSVPPAPGSSRYRLSVPKKKAKKHSLAPSKKALESSDRRTRPVRQPSPKEHECASAAGALSRLKGPSLILVSGMEPTTLPALSSSQAQAHREHSSPPVLMTSAVPQAQAKAPREPAVKTTPDVGKCHLSPEKQSHGRLQPCRWSPKLSPRMPRHYSPVRGQCSPYYERRCSPSHQSASRHQSRSPAPCYRSPQHHSPDADLPGTGTVLPGIATGCLCLVSAHQ